MKRLARWLRTLAARIDRPAQLPELSIDLDDEESLSATEYAIVSMRLLDIEERLAAVEDATGLTPGSISAALFHWPENA